MPKISDANKVPCGFQALAVSNTAVGLTIPLGPYGLKGRAVYLAAEGAVRWRDDGTPPTSSVGNPFADTDLFYDGDLSAIRFIAQTSDAVVNCTYYTS